MTSLDRPTTSPTEPARSGLHRRTLVGAAAWAAPAIALSAASPAAAASVTPGVITITDAPTSLKGGDTYTVTGVVTLGVGVALPSQVVLDYGVDSAVFGPATAGVQADGTFFFTITARKPTADTSSTVTVSAPDHTSASFTVLVVPAPLGTIELTSTPGDIPEGEQGTATGKVTPPAGVAMPSTVSLSSSSTGVATVPVRVAVAADGTFTIPVTAVAASGTSTITVSAPGYTDVSFTARVVAFVASGLGTMYSTVRPPLRSGYASTMGGQFIAEKGRQIPKYIGITFSRPEWVQVYNQTSLVSPQGNFSFVFVATAQMPIGATLIATIVAPEGWGWGTAGEAGNVWDWPMVLTP